MKEILHYIINILEYLFFILYVVTIRKILDFFSHLFLRTLDILEKHNLALKYLKYLHIIKAIQTFFHELYIIYLLRGKSFFKQIRDFIDKL